MVLECSLFHSHSSQEKKTEKTSLVLEEPHPLWTDAPPVACSCMLHCRRINIIKTVDVFCFFFSSLGSAHIHAHSSCCSRSKAQAHTHTHNINRRFALFLLPMWLFITTGRQPLFEKSCRQQEYRLLERKEEESFIRARMTRRMWLLSLTNQLDRLVETRVETDVLHHNAVFLELVMLRPAGAGRMTFLDTWAGYCLLRRPQQSRMMHCSCLEPSSATCSSIHASVWLSSSLHWHMW